MCDHCRNTRQRSIYEELTPEQREYDRQLEDQYSDVQILNVPMLFPGESKPRLPTLDDYKRKSPAQRYTKASPSTHGADKTTPDLSTPTKVNARVSELMDKLKNMMEE
jgi:hypothetical protein